MTLVENVTPACIEQLPDSLIFMDVAYLDLFPERSSTWRRLSEFSKNEPRESGLFPRLEHAVLSALGELTMALRKGEEVSLLARDY